MQYLTPCDIRVLDEGGYFEVIKPFRYFHLKIGIDEVDSGFVTNFASLPPLPIFLDFLVKVNDESRKPSVIHDWLYGRAGKVNGLLLSRKDCDKIFLDGLKLSGVALITRHMMYRAVRLFGGSNFG